MSKNYPGAFPHHPQKISPAWLTNRLKTNGLLDTGNIVDVDIKPLGGVYLAQSAILNLEYSKRATGAKPDTLFIKIARPDVKFGDITAGEVEFFQKYNPPVHLPIARCLDICIDKNSGMSCLLLEDLSKTHIQHPWLLPPTIDECHAVMKTFAQIHAFWWDSEDLPSVGDSSIFQTRQNNTSKQLQTILPKFLDFIGDRLTTKHKQIMCDVCDCLPRLMHQRMLNINSTTLIHGDAHFWNVMLPKDTQAHGPVFIDWEEWTRGISGYDLAYMIALQWSRERRRQLELPLLSTYYQTLMDCADITYSFDDLIRDYRLGCLRNFIIPAFLLEMEIEPYIWWPYIEKLYLAYEDLECEKLL